VCAATEQHRYGLHDMHVSYSHARQVNRRRRQQTADDGAADARVGNKKNDNRRLQRRIPASCYHRCIKSFFGYDRLYSVTAILLDLQLPSFDTLLYNYKFSFSMQITCSGNAVVKYLDNFGM